MDEQRGETNEPAQGSSGAGRWRVALLLVLLGAGGFLWWWRAHRRTTEQRVAARLHEATRERAGDQGLFGYQMGIPPDIWSTGEACAALAAYGDPDDLPFIRRMVDYTVQTRLPKPPPGYKVPHGGWPIDPGDTIGAGEPTGWVGCAIGMAALRLGKSVEPAVRDMRAMLLGLQNPDGSYSSVFIGPEAARTSATQDALLALIVLTAASGGQDAAMLDAIEHACGWFGTTFDPQARVWYPRVRLGWKNRATVPGCSETTVWLLLEARDLLRAAGRELPPEARTALESFAEAFRPDHRTNLRAALPADRYDYQFDLPEGQRTTWGRFGHRWSWFPYRMLCVTRLANTPGLPRKAEWKREEAWLLEHLEPFAVDLKKLPTFQLSESLFMASIIASRPADHPRRGSVVDLIERARRDAGR